MPPGSNPKHTIYAFWNFIDLVANICLLKLWLNSENKKKIENNQNFAEVDWLAKNKTIIGCYNLYSRKVRPFWTSVFARFSIDLTQARSWTIIFKSAIWDIISKLKCKQIWPLGAGEDQNISNHNLMKRPSLFTKHPVGTYECWTWINHLHLYIEITTDIRVQHRRSPKCEEKPSQSVSEIQDLAKERQVYKQ